MGHGRDRDDVPFSGVGGGPLSSYSNRCPPTSSCTWGEHRLRSVHLQAGGRGGRVRDLGLRTSSLGFGPAEWDLTLQSSQVAFRRKVICVSCHPSISVLFTSSRTHLQHLRSFCTRSGQELACAHQTDGRQCSAKPAHSHIRRPLRSAWESPTSGFSLLGVQSRSGARI